MATIKISDLHPTGFDLLLDSESYLNELTDEELNMTHGGSTPACVIASATIVTLVVTIASPGLPSRRCRR